MKRQITPLLAVALLLATGVLWLHRRRQPSVMTHRLQALSTWGLGEYLGRTFPEGEVLILSNPFVRDMTSGNAIAAQEKSRLNGLLQSLEPKAASIQVVYPELRPGAVENPQSLVLDPSTTTPLSYLIRPGAVDDLVAAHPGTDLLVSLVGLPLPARTCQAWTGSGDPGFALLLPDLRTLGGSSGVRRAMDRGKLVAIVLRRPDIPSEEEQSVSDLTLEAFSNRFLLVTPDNLEATLSQWPEILEAR